MAGQNQASQSKQGQGGKSGAQAAKPVQGRRPASASRPANGNRPAGGGRPTSASQQAAAQSKLPRQRSASAAETTAADGRPTGFRAVFRSMGWLQLTTFALSLLGLGDSIYLTSAEIAAHGGKVQVSCPGGGGVVSCFDVLNSSQSDLFGHIPMAYLGLGFFVFMVVITSPWAWRADRQPILAPWAQIRRIRMTAVGIGMVFVLYLVYAEIIEIGHICLYCTGVHIITFLLFCLLVFHTTFSSEPAEVR